MKKMKCFASLILVAGSLISNVFATPTSLFWTNCTTDTLDTGIVNVDVDNYFTILEGRGKGSSFSPDIGATLGVFSWHDLKAEAGVDYIAGVDNDFFFNGKVGMEEGKLFQYAPSWSLGMFDIGTKPHRTNFNIIDLVIGKSLPDIIGGRFFLGGYGGTTNTLGKNRGGIMVGFDRGFRQVKDKEGTSYYKWHFSADFASGKNVIGGGGFALSHYFSPYLYIETGPVWFNAPQINGQWKWALQINFGRPCFASTGVKDAH